MSWIGAASPAAVIAIAVVVWAVSAGVELVYGSPRRRAVRLAAMSVAILCLATLCLRPRLRRAAGGSPVYLLTEGAGELSREALTSLDPRLAVWRLPGTGSDPVRGARTAVDTSDLALRSAGATRFLILGDGLDEWELEELPAPVELLATPEAAAGIERIEWQRRIVLGDTVTIRGLARQRAEGGVIELSGPAGPETRLELDGDGAFELRVTPRATGPLLYRLRLLGPDETVVQSAALDLEVIAPERLHLLWLEASPSFEAGAVKRWIAEQGLAIALRTRVSRDRYRTEVHNLSGSQPDLERLGLELLRRFDLVVADGRTVAGWGAAELRAIDRAIGEEGIGLLIVARPEEPLEPLSRFGGFEVVSEPRQEEWLLRLELDGVSPPPLTAAARRLRLSQGVRPLLSDAAGRVLAGSRPRRRGVVAVTLIADTYRWPLLGRSDAHRAYWRRLVHAVARPASAEGWRLAAGPFMAGAPRRLALVTEAAAPSARWSGPGGDAVGLALRQEGAGSRRWSAVLRPRGEGWHRLEAGSATAVVYAQRPQGWTALRRSRRQHATRVQSLAAGPRGGAAAAVGWWEVPRWAALVGLLVSIAVLWAEPWRS